MGQLVVLVAVHVVHVGLCASAAAGLVSFGVSPWLAAAAGAGLGWVLLHLMGAHQARSTQRAVIALDESRRHAERLAQEIEQRLATQRETAGRAR